MVNLDSIFDQELLRDLVVAKDNILKSIHMAKMIDLTKNKADFVRPGSYMIWDIIEKTDIFKN